jgi:hypothetical protein
MKPPNRATLIIGFALLLRGLRVLCRWDEWALHYAGYYGQIVQDLDRWDLDRALTTWTGLHPPLFGFFHGLMELHYPAPGLWLLWSAAFSLLAVVALLRSKGDTVSWVAALIVATDPVQLHYAAEVNNYPMLTGLIGLAWWARSHHRWVLLALLGVLGAWTHILGGVVIGLMVLTSTFRWRTLFLMAAGVVPLVPGALGILTDFGYQKQPPLRLADSAADALSRFSPSFLLLLPVLALGAIKRPGMAAVWAGTIVFWIVMVLMGIAAPHQFPYAVALGVPAAILVAHGAGPRLLLQSVVALCLLRACWVATLDISRLSTVWQDADASAAVASVLQGAGENDGIVLVRGLSEQDDDKRHTSAVLWRFPPWERMRARAGRGEPEYLVGNPRRWRRYTLYTFDQPRPAIATLWHKRVFTIAYGAAAEDLDIPKHPSQGDWQWFGDIAVRMPKSDPASTAPD